MTATGVVKIVDFGLAKHAESEPALTGMSRLPTTPPMTDAGTVLGTPGRPVGCRISVVAAGGQGQRRSTDPADVDPWRSADP